MSEFKTEQLLPEALTFENPKVLKAKLQGLTPEQIRSIEEQEQRDRLNPWVVLTKAYDDVYRRHLAYPIEKMAQNRAVDEHSDLFALSQGARLQGFDLQQDFYARISERTLSKILPMLPHYVDYNSGNSWASFIGLLLDGKVRIEQLWTKDYVNFSSAPGGLTLVEGGEWFKSTHVNVTLAYAGYKNTLAQLGAEFTSERARSLLEEYMPINLVIERLGFYLGMTAHVYVGAALGRIRQRTLVDNEEDHLLVATTRYLTGVI